MKKVIAILAVMMVVLGCVFADGTDAVGLGGKKELKVTTSVQASTPTFQMVGSLNVGTSGKVTSEIVTGENHAGNSVLTAPVGSILSGPIVATCVLSQAVDCKWVGTFYLRVSATALSGTGSDEKTYSTANPEISSLEAMNNIGAVDGDANAVRTTDVATADQAKVTYGSGRSAAAGDVASFTVTWPKTDLPPAEYTAYITMIVSAS